MSHVNLIIKPVKESIRGEGETVFFSYMSVETNEYQVCEYSIMLQEQIIEDLIACYNRDSIHRQENLSQIFLKEQNMLVERIHGTWDAYSGRGTTCTKVYCCVKAILMSVRMSLRLKKMQQETNLAKIQCGGKQIIFHVIYHAKWCAQMTNFIYFPFLLQAEILLSRIFIQEDSCFCLLLFTTCVVEKRIISSARVLAKYLVLACNSQQ